MPMRTECKHYESRTYANGDAVRKCNLDLAPDAPWRCPDNCVKYERRLADVAWAHGTMTPPTPAEVPGLDDGTAAAVLDEAENIVNAIGAELLSEFTEMDAAKSKSKKFWQRIRRRRHEG